uniref:U2A'/phosphoprotein 32 family A C-terminal domain-containing protein n=1 Tax=Opuntia streptacantha TaxID=393608 RepID=A0A7C9EZ11_OPUST
MFSTENGDFSARGFYRRTSSVSGVERKKYLSHHPSPICFEKNYRDYMIASLPQLQVLDNLPISNRDKENAKLSFSKYFEYLPYKRPCKESIVSILRKRELNTSCSHVRKHKPSGLQTNSAYYHTRSLGAAKVGSSTWPSVHPLSTSGYVYGDEKKIFRPRQFEYHPSDSGLMAFGTLDGEVVVVNHESEKIFSYVPSLGAMNSILGLCWLKKYPSRVCSFRTCTCSVLRMFHTKIFYFHLHAQTTLCYQYKLSVCYFILIPLLLALLGRVGVALSAC